MQGPEHTYREQGLRVDVFVTGSWKENCYLITDENLNITAILDPGDDADRIIQYVRQKKLNLSLLLLTHAHYDHIGAIEKIAGIYDLTCHVHEKDKQLLKRAPLYALSFEKRKIKLPKDVEYFQDESCFQFGSHTIRIIPSPGHTEGSVCLCLGTLVFSGDTLLFERRGRTDLPGGDAATLEKTITLLLQKLDTDQTLYPGHKQPWSVEAARRWWANQSEATS